MKLLKLALAHVRKETTELESDITQLGVNLTQNIEKFNIKTDVFPLMGKARDITTWLEAIEEASKTPPQP